MPEGGNSLLRQNYKAAPLITVGYIWGWEKQKKAAPA